MDAFTGKYYLQGGAEEIATLLLLKDKISKGIKDENETLRTLFLKIKTTY